MKLRCPYCAAVLSPPLESAACLACGKVMGIPEKYRKRGGEDKTQVFHNIAHNAERQRAAFQFQGSPKFLRQPSILFLVLVALVALGGLMVSMSRSPEERRPPVQKEEHTRQELRVIAIALELYRHHVGHYPTAEEGGLYALVENPGVPGWQGRYVSGIFRDAWNTPYRYEHGGDVVTLFSCGPDRKPFTEDDLHANPEDFILDPVLLTEWAMNFDQPATVTIGGNLNTENTERMLRTLDTEEK